MHENVVELEDAAITQFWTWWADAGRALAIDDANPDAFSSGLRPVLECLDQAFATGVIIGVFTGGAAERTIVLAYDADPAGRALGERWLAAAPAADADVDFKVFFPPTVDSSGWSDPQRSKNSDEEMRQGASYPSVRHQVRPSGAEQVR